MITINIYVVNKANGGFDEYLNLNEIPTGSEYITIQREVMTPEEIVELDKLNASQVITRRQFKIALAFLGYNEENILNGINQLPEPTKTIANISYREAGTFERSNPELIFVAKTFLQLTDEQIDEIFVKGNEF